MRRLLPFTLLTLGGLLTAAAATATLRSPLERRRLARVGFAPRDLEGPGWHRLVTSALVTHGPRVLARALAATALTVGTAEHRHGTAHAAATFWGVHLATLLATSGGVLAARALGGEGLAPHLPRDVGPSAGYFGCLGLVCSGLPDPPARLAGALVLAGLCAAPFLPPPSPEGADAKRFADAAHLIAFPLGWVSGRLGGRADR